MDGMCLIFIYRALNCIHLKCIGHALDDRFFLCINSCQALRIFSEYKASAKYSDIWRDLANDSPMIQVWNCYSCVLYFDCIDKLVQK